MPVGSSLSDRRSRWCTCARQADRRGKCRALRSPAGAMVASGGSLGIRPWQKTAGSPAILGDRPEDRRFCVPAFRRVCPCQQFGLAPSIRTSELSDRHRECRCSWHPHSDVEQTAFYGASALSRSALARQARLCRRLRTLNRDNEHTHHMRSSHQATCHVKRSASKPSSGVFAVEPWLTSTGCAFYSSRPFVGP